MAAPKNNQYYLKRIVSGRPPKYTPKQWAEKMMDYLDYMDGHTWDKQEAIKSGDKVGTLISVPTKTPLTIQGFCNFAGVSSELYARYKSDKGFEDYHGITTYMDGIIKQNQLEGSMVGAYNPNIVARLLGLAEKTETDHTSGGQSLPPVVINIQPLKEDENFPSSEDELEGVKES